MRTKQAGSGVGDSEYGKKKALAEKMGFVSRCLFRGPRASCLRAAFCLLPAAYCFLAAQQPSPAPSGNSNQTFTIKAQTNVVLVDVRVWDKAGNPVTDLKPEDFKVYEDGARQQITSFSIEKVAQLEAASAENGAPPTIDLASLPPSTPPEQVMKLLQDRRLLVLFFDQSSMQPDDLIRALNSAIHFVDVQMTPADLVAVVTYSSDLRIAQNFTNDRKQLDKVLKQIQLGEASFLAEAGSEGDAGGTNASGAEIVSQDVSAAFTPDETEFNIFNTDEKLGAIESLSEMLRGVPGRKSVIHFSSGLQRTGVDNQAELRAAEDAANQSNVSLYTVDSRGLVALPPGGDASSSAPSGTALYSGSAVNSQVTSLQETRETLAALSADTGGRTFYDLNDFSSAYQRIEEDNSTYYLLGYSPSNGKSDGRFRRIKVEVDRPGVKVQSRPGYFAPKNFRQFTREDKEMQLEQAMDLDTPFVDLPMAIGADYFRQAGGKYYVVLSSKIPGTAVSFMQKSDAHQTEFDFAWRATNQAGATVAALRDTLPVKLSPETYQQVVAGNILYEGGFVLPPGQYHLKVVARENASGKIGTFEQNLNLPATDQPGLSLSSVVLSNQLRDEAAGNRNRRRPSGGEANPLEVGSHAILPSVTRVFRNSQDLYVYLESYQAKAAKPGQAPAASASLPPSFALVFFRGGVQVSEAGPFTGKVERSPEGKTAYFVKIPLAKFPTGRYQMQVNVIAPALDQVAFARVPLAIMKPPAVVPVAPPSGR